MALLYKYIELNRVMALLYKYIELWYTVFYLFYFVFIFSYDNDWFDSRNNSVN
jgi:hypothetical protein